MTTNKINTRTKNILSVFIVTLLLVSVYSCSKKSVATSRSKAPAETTLAAPESTIAIPEVNKGQVEIKRDVNSNYVIQISLKDLEAVNTIEPSAAVAYIVWMYTDTKMVKNLGEISSKTGWLADKSKSSFEAVSAIKPTKIFITEENTATVTKPGTKIIWSTGNF
jgi:hypothetical protein